ncbi:MAG: hypothetical protein EOP58_10955 [Sphingomonadales bacterium]|nr:MAG: hypothetical protein EOP58_10955 [Sphingomonadales bacterium]
MFFTSLLALAAAQTAPAAAPETLITVSVQKLPAAYKQAPVVRLEFNNTGAVIKCDIEKPSGSPGIDKVACQQAVQVKLDVVDNVAPAPRSAIIAFNTEPAQ